MLQQRLSEHSPASVDGIDSITHIVGVVVLIGDKRVGERLEVGDLFLLGVNGPVEVLVALDSSLNTLGTALAAVVVLERVLARLHPLLGGLAVAVE